MGQKAAQQKEISGPAWLDALPSLWLLAIGLPLSRASFDQKYLALGLVSGLSLLLLALSRRAQEIPSTFLKALGLWALAWLVSRIFSSYPAIAGPRLMDQTLWLGLALWGASQPMSGRARLWLTLSAALTLLLLALYALAQSRGLEWVVDYKGVSNSRPFATFGNASFLAAFVVGLWPLAAWRGQAPSPRWIYFFWGAVLVLVLSATRSGLLAITFQALLWQLFLEPRARRPARFSAAWIQRALLWGLPLLAALYLWQRPTQRLPLWQASAKLALASPIWGHGPGSFPAAIQGSLSPELKAEFARTQQFAEHPHNWLLHLACEGGVLLLGAFSLIVFLVLWRAWVKAREGNDWAMVLGLGIAGLTLQNLFDRNFELAAGAGLLWFGLGALNAPAGPPKAAPAWQRLLLLVLGCLSLWAATRPWATRRAALAQSGGMPQVVAQDQINRYQDMIRANPRDPGAWFALGTAQASQGQFAMAAASFANAHRLRPDPRALVNEANCYLSLDQAALAEARSREALRLDKSRGTAWYTLGVALFQQRKIAEAQEALTRALEIDPQDARARHLKEQILR